jgi:hypothetical protein
MGPKNHPEHHEKANGSGTAGTAVELSVAALGY